MNSAELQLLVQHQTDQANQQRLNTKELEHTLKKAFFIIFVVLGTVALIIAANGIYGTQTAISYWGCGGVGVLLFAVGIIGCVRLSC